MLMRKPRAFAEVYNDLDDDVVNVFRIMRDPEQAAALGKLIELTPWSRTEFFASYNEADNHLEKARRTIVRSLMGFGTTGQMLNRTGFRGKCERANNTGVADFQNYPGAIEGFVRRLKGVVIENRRAIDLIKAQDDEDTLFYVDPPYPHSSRTSLRSAADFGRCYKHEMHNIEHRQLGELLTLVRGMVVVSGYHCDLYDNELFADWKCVEKNTHADGGKKRVECLWLNRSAVKNLRVPA